MVGATGAVGSAAVQIARHLAAQAAAYRPLIGSVFPLSEIALAHAQADSGHMRGNLVIEMAPKA